jgi:hypothetical protein
MVELRRYIIAISFIFAFGFIYNQYRYIADEILKYKSIVFYENSDCPSMTQTECSCDKYEKQFDFNIIFIETHFTRTRLTNKQLCAIEAAALHNPTAKINIFAVQNKDNLNLLTDQYKNIFLEKMDFDVLFKDTPYDAWWKSDRLSNHTLIRMAHLSDGLRFLLLHKLGGIYLDLDVYTLTSYKDLIGHDSFCASKAHRLKAYHSGLLIGNKGSKFYEACIEEFASTYKPEKSIYNGPGLIHRVTHRYCKLLPGLDILIYIGPNPKNPNEPKPLKLNYTLNQKCDVTLLPGYIAYPYQHSGSSILYEEDVDIPLEKFIHCKAIHAYDSKTRAKQINQKTGRSIMDFFYKFNCPIMYEHIINSDG